MKILSLSYLDLWPHGEGKGIPSIFFAQKGLVERGHEVHFVCPVRKTPAGYSVYQGIHLYRLRLPFDLTSRLSKYIRLDKPLSHLKATLLFNLAWLFFQIFGFIELVRVALKVHPDVIYSHDLTPAFPAWLTSRIFGTKFIFRIYGSRNLYWQYHRFWPRLKECREYAALKLPADFMIITKDGTNADLLARELGVRDEKIRSWRNGVDFGLYDPSHETKIRVLRQFGLKEDSKIILSTSRLIPFYDVGRLIYSLPKVFEINSDAVCIVASDGPQKQPLEEFVRSKNISHRVFFTGMVEKQALKELLNASDIYINLTSLSNCNNALFEAMVAGKCIVAFDNPQIRELIESGESGYLVYENELEYIPGILCRLLTDDGLRRGFGEKVRQAAQKKLWGWEERIDAEAKLLESIR
ncbi:MAG: glycosyltransferase family 4 protein [Candidatus Omnitrophica bacterium]|nr:glycosyltransferase family 4 protein [Candidatus Omnitrophota bacterium]